METEEIVATVAAAGLIGFLIYKIMTKPAALTTAQANAIAAQANAGATAAEIGAGTSALTSLINAAQGSSDSSDSSS